MGQQNASNSSGTDIQKILEAGTAAAQLMSSPIFQMAYRETLNSYFNEWIATKVDHVKEREFKFARVHALQDVANTLAGYHQHAESIQQAMQENPDQFKAEAYQ